MQLNTPVPPILLASQSRIAALEAANAGAAAAAAGAPVHAAHLAAFIRSVNEGLADPEAAYTVMPGANGLTPPAHWPATGLSRWSLGALTGAALRDLLADFALPAVAEGVGVELRRRNAIAAHIGARLF